MPSKCCNLPVSEALYVWKSAKHQEKGSCRNPRGIFPNKALENFAGDFIRPFSLEKRRKIHPKIHGKIQIRIWELRGQNPHRKDLALTKQRSHLDGERSRTCQHLSSFNCENPPVSKPPIRHSLMFCHGQKLLHLGQNGCEQPFPLPK